MIFKYSKWNSAFCYCSAGACVCFVGYLITQEAPKLVALISSSATPRIKTENINNQVVTDNKSKKAAGKKASGGSELKTWPWWTQIGNWFKSTFGFGSIHIPNTYI